uniref:Uncharacterized protein n=1 Tax=Peronospora matthiolae TaxID=2874970 RepID=A0AAV1UFS3_9STRA
MYHRSRVHRTASRSQRVRFVGSELALGERVSDLRADMEEQELVRGAGRSF